METETKEEREQNGTKKELPDQSLLPQSRHYRNWVPDLTPNGLNQWHCFVHSPSDYLQTGLGLRVDSLKKWFLNFPKFNPSVSSQEERQLPPSGFGSPGTHPLHQHFFDSHHVRDLLTGRVHLLQ
jgi:hypothetical protein